MSSVGSYKIMSTATNWAGGLIKTINDSKNHLISSDIGVVINDKYPKAKYHFLVMPKEDISSIYHLKREHIPVLEEIHLLGLNIIEIRRKKIEDFNIGFHAQPSMQHLHLHVISKDFVSDCLKTKKHWNSFNTKLFLPYNVVLQEVMETGSLRRLENSEIKKLLALDLRCNQCEYVAKNMPNLKEHLLEHYNT